ncbi:Ku protein [Streptomyces sp. NBC_01232]|uniref:Ku protein n=1 Tax=Streptomyces sp. NBC_01232 TaxID=2903786 RepID=UPI003FA3B191
MARPVWTGILSFGLVSLPVSLYTATDIHTIHFHQLQRGTSDRIRNRRVNERTGKEMELEEIVKGFDTGEEYVLVEPKELDEIAPGRSRTIEVSGFVDLDTVDPIFYRGPYRPPGAATAVRRARRGPLHHRILGSCDNVRPVQELGFRDHTAYLKAFTAKLGDCQKARYILPEDAVDMRRRAGLCPALTFTQAYRDHYPEYVALRRCYTL